MSRTDGMSGVEKKLVVQSKRGGGLQVGGPKSTHKSGGANDRGQQRTVLGVHTELLDSSQVDWIVKLLINRSLQAK